MDRARTRVLGLLPKASVGAEVGVWKGDFAAEIVKALKPTKLYLIDPWAINEAPSHKAAWYGSEHRLDMQAIYTGVRKRFRREVSTGSIVIMRKRSSVALASLPDNSLDFAYIDGDHAYQGVRRDCYLAYQKVRVGGFICGDDYSDGYWWKDGVIRAFHDLICHRNVLICYAYGTQIVVRKRKGDYTV